MKKLSLTLDALRVESFDTGRTEDHRGTVRGYDVTASCVAPQATCGGSCMDPATCVDNSCMCDSVPDC